MINVPENLIEQRVRKGLYRKAGLYGFPGLWAAAVHTAGAPI